MISIIKNLLLSNIDIAPTDERYHRVIMINVSFLIALPVLLIFVVVNAIKEDFLMVVLDFLFISQSAFGLYYLRKSHDIDKVATFALLVLSAVIFIVLVVQTAIDYSLVWSLLFAFAVMILKGAKKGLYYSIVFYSIIFIIVYSFIGDTITLSGYIRFVAISIIMVVLAYFYESTTQGTFSMLRNSMDEVEYLNKNLKSEIKDKIKEQSLLLSLFDKGNTVLFKWNNDADWTVDYVSLSVESLLGYSKNDVISDKFDYASLIHHDDIQRVRDEVSKAEESKVKFFKHEPYRVFTKDGSIKFILDNTTVVRDENDDIIFFVGIIADITELKKQEKLIQQQSRLAQMGEMIAMIAHQWRQPLGAISSTSIDLKMKIMLETFDLQKQDDRDKCIEYFSDGLENIDKYVQNLTTTIDDFRNFYKSNKKPATVKLEDTVKKSLNIIGASLANNNIEIIIEHRDNEKIEQYDSEMMQVILNILKNAQDNFKEKKTENPYIKIITENRSITICDNGGGIPEDIIDKIFDPYYSTKDEKNGTGLGLYMSKTIVEEHHNGRLSVENIDDGACFAIELNPLR